MRYRYPFVQSANASWAARCFGREIEQRAGQVEVRGRHFFVMLPDTICPESIGQLGLFTYDQVQDDRGNVVQRIKPNAFTAA